MRALGRLARLEEAQGRSPGAGANEALLEAEASRCLRALDRLIHFVASEDVAVWAEVAPEPAAVPGLAEPYQAAGATWWIETAKPEPHWWKGITARVGAGVAGRA